MDFKTIIGGILCGLFIVLVIALVVGFPVMLLWNWLMPAIFGLCRITFCQAFGLSLLCGFLFNRGGNNSKN